MISGGSKENPVAGFGMVARPKELLRELRVGDTVKALKAIKNQVIGSKSGKAAFLSEGAVEQVLEVLRTCNSKSPDVEMQLVQQQAAVVIGSLTYGTEFGLRELVAHQGLPQLVSMLSSSDEAVVEAGLRAIKMVLQQSTAFPSFLTATTDCSGAYAAADTPLPLPQLSAGSTAAAAAAVRLDAAGVSAVVRCLCRVLGLTPAATTTTTTTTSTAAAVTSPGAGSGCDPAGNSDSGPAGMECEPAPAEAEAAEAAPGPGSDAGCAAAGGSAAGGSAAAAVTAAVGPGLTVPTAPTAAAAVAGAAAGAGGRAASVAALAAAVVACCCRREEERALAITAGAPAALLTLLLGTERPDTQVSALEGLSLMLPRHPPCCELALSRPGVYGKLLGLLRDPSPAVRLLAANCVAALSRTPGCGQSEAMQRAALPVLLRLLAHPATRPHVPAVLARLIEASEPLQKAAADADTVRLLAGLLAAEATAATPPQQPPNAAVTAVPATAAPVAAPAAVALAVSPSTSAAAPVSDPAGCALREGCLRALGSLCLSRDDSRKQLLEAKVLRHIVRSLEDPSDGVRAAAALCVRALTRCVRTLRGGLLEGGGELAPLLVGLLGDSNQDVQASAAAAVCNLVLDFSAAKSAVLAAGGLPCLVALTAPGRPPQLRHHAVWALANMLYRSDQGVRGRMMQALPWPRLRRLLYDSDPGVVEQALVVLRNLCMGDRNHIQAAVQWASFSGAAEACGVVPDAAAAAAAAGAGSPGPGAPGPGAADTGPGGGRKEAEEEQEQEATAAEAGVAARGGDLLDVLQGVIEAARGLSGSGDDADEEDEDEAAAAEEEEGDEFEDERDVDARPASTTFTSPCSTSPTANSPTATFPTAANGATVTTNRLAQHASHALYAIANLLTGGGAVKDMLAARRALLAGVVSYMRPGAAAELALPAVWCAINLVWPCGPSGAVAATATAETEAVAARCRVLLELGAAERLEVLQSQHPARDVQERARTALEQLRKGAGPAAVAAAAAAAAAAVTAGGASAAVAAGAVSVR